MNPHTASVLLTVDTGGLTNPYGILAVMSGVAALVLAGVTWTRREADGAGTYAGLLAVLAGWALLYAGQLLAPTVAGKTPWVVARHAVAPGIAVVVWVFTARYTSRPELLARRYSGPILAAGGLIAVAVVLNPGRVYFRSLDLYTGGSFPRLRPAYGPAFWVQVAYLAGVIGAAHVYIVGLMRRTFRAYRTQLTVLTVTGAIEFSLLFLHITEHVGFIPTLNPFPYVDLIVFGAVLLAVPIGWSYRKQAYFHLKPLGREAVMEHIDDAVLVFDVNDRCVYGNAAARDLLGADAPDVDRRPTASALLAARPAIHDRYRAAASGSASDGDTAQEAVPVEVDGETRYYDLDASVVRDSRGARAGTALVARDVTRLRRQAERLDAFAGTVTHDLRIKADPAVTRTIIENLLRNSVKHGSTGSRTESDDTVARTDPPVTVTVGRLGDADDFAGFYVEDDGDGIPPEERARIFEYGYTTGDDGTGFGLTIVREGVEAHGWSIEATEGEGGGARFEITGVDRAA